MHNAEGNKDSADPNARNSWSSSRMQLSRESWANLRGEFNKFPDFFVQAFKIVVDSWKFSILFLYILWDDWPIFMISGSKEQL